MTRHFHPCYFSAGFPRLQPLPAKVRVADIGYHSLHLPPAVLTHYYTHTTAALLRVAEVTVGADTPATTLPTPMQLRIWPSVPASCGPNTVSGASA